MIDRRIRELTAALTERATQALKAGLPTDVLASATAELTAERDALVRHREQLRAWQQHNAAESARMRQLWYLAELAHRRLATMTASEQKVHRRAARHPRHHRRAHHPPHPRAACDTPRSV